MSTIPLSRQELANYKRNGFLYREAMFTPQDLQEVTKDVDDLLALDGQSSINNPAVETRHSASGKAVPFRLRSAANHSKAIRELLSSERIVDVAKTILGPNVFCAYDSIVMKANGMSFDRGWHRDADTYPGVRGINIGIYLDPATLSNCVWFLPMSHVEAIRPADSSVVPLIATSGAMTIHDLNVLHCSPGSNNSGLRRVVYFEFHDMAATNLTQDYISGRPNLNYD